MVLKEVSLDDKSELEDVLLKPRALLGERETDIFCVKVGMCTADVGFVLRMNVGTWSDVRFGCRAAPRLSTDFNPPNLPLLTDAALVMVGRLKVSALCSASARTI